MSLFLRWQYIMEDIFFCGTPLLEAVGEHEPPVEELRQTVRSAINKALIPLRAYAKEYERHLSLINLDINNYIKYVVSMFFTSTFCSLKSKFIFV